MPWSLADHPANVLSVFTSFQPGYRLVDGGDLLTVANLLFSVQEGADGGTDEQSASPIINCVTDAVQGTTFVLPPGVQGRYAKVINNSSGQIQIYGMSPDPYTGLIDTIAPAGSSVQQLMVPQEPGEACEYWCFAPGLWKQVSGIGAGAPGPQGGIPEAPLNGQTYGRNSGTWVPVLALAGGTMTGPIILPPGPATDPNQAISLSELQALAIDEGTY